MMPLLTPFGPWGNLYVCTDRLEEAERAYQTALPIFCDIDDGLGEAGLIQSLGNLAMLQEQPMKAFSFHQQALEVQMAIQDEPGQGDSFGYLARAAAAAGELERAAALSHRSLVILERTGSRFGQLLSLQMLFGVLAALEHEAAPAALFLAWATATEIDDPRASLLEPLVRQVFEPTRLDERAETARAMRSKLEQALSELAASLEACGIGLLDPLTSLPPEPDAPNTPTPQEPE